MSPVSLRTCRPSAAAPHSLHHARRIITLLTIGLLATAAGVNAQGTGNSAPASTTSGPANVQAAAQDDEDDDSVLNPAEPDYVLVNLPTTARLPVLKGNFRISHRFAGNLNSDDFSELASSLFGIDQGAIIGFEYRIGIMRGLQAVLFRTNFDRTVQFHAKYDAIRQRNHPVAVSAIVSVEGTDNFHKKHAPAIGVVLSRTVADRMALYASPIWVNNTAASLTTEHTHDATNADESDHVHASTTFVGLGARIRVNSRVYLVGEVSPRLDGYKPGKPAYGFGLEKRVGRHTFSLTFTNTFAMTYAQLARGGNANSLYLGFNIGRKFF